MTKKEKQLLEKIRIAIRDYGARFMAATTAEEIIMHIDERLGIVKKEKL